MSSIASGSLTDASFRAKFFTKDNQEIVGQRIIAYRFTIYDFEDPDVYAAEKLREWENSDAGRWTMAHSLETPTWLRAHDYSIMGQNYIVVAWLTDKDLTFYNLKFQ